MDFQEALNNDVLINVVVAVVVGAFFYWLGNRASKQLIDELKDYIREGLLPYANQLQHAINNLEGKNVEGEGRIVIERDVSGNPTELRIAPPQVIDVPALSLEAKAYGATVEIGPPPTPPGTVGKELSLGWQVHEPSDDEHEGTQRGA